VVVALGETFPCREGDTLAATLEGSPAQIMLTLVRSMRVTELQLCVPT